MGIFDPLKRKKKHIETWPEQKPLEKYELKFMFDWGSGSCVWSSNDIALKLYGDYPILTEQLPISSHLKSVLDDLIKKHDEALDWDCPQNDLLWSKEQVEAFKAEALTAYQQLCVELGEEYEVALVSLI